MTNTRAAKKVLLCVVAMAVVLATLLTSFSITVSAATSVANEFDNTDVLEDLKSATVNGKPFDLSNYPLNESGSIQVLNFVEYCYSNRSSMQGNYGLYVYIYNPSGKNLATGLRQSSIQMAAAYDENGTPTDYVKFSLQFCSKVTSGDYKNLFYKFKVVDKPINGKGFLDRVNSNARRYDVSGVEFTTYGANTATEYHVGATYIFTGYAAGYGPEASAASTLNCSVGFMETVSLSVKHTFYRSETSALGAGHQNQLDTVYFSVPKRLLDNYGKLQRIKAEWYEYKTAPILVTSHSGFYDAAFRYTGTYMGDLNEYGMYEANKDIGYAAAIGATTGGGMSVAQWGWNLGTGYLHPACQRLCYMFYTSNIDEYDPYGDITEMGGVQSNTLYDYIRNYSKSYASGTLPIKDGKISADLFASDIDESRKMNNESGVIQQGYSYYDFDADVDTQVLSSWQSTSPSFWQNWLNFGLGAAFTGGPEEESIVVPPIQILNSADLAGTNDEIARRLLVNVADVDSIKNEYHDAVTVSGAQDEEKVLVLFRFATSDYYSGAVDLYEFDAGFLGGDKKHEGQAYMAMESVFFDFDIIQLTFNKDGVYTVIPVVSSPIDVVNSITPPVNMPSEVEWWKIVLAVLLIIILLVLLAPVLPYIVRAIIWLIMLPFKLIAAIIKSFKKARKRRKEKKAEKDFMKEE